MLSVIIIVLLTLVITMLFLHLYGRWYLTRARRLHNHRLPNQSRTTSTTTHFVFYVDPNNNNNNPNNGPAATANRGLDPSVLKSLPVFIYGYESLLKTIIECAVCLSEFEDNETVRYLPKCNHGFHIDCIDMWFHSHSTCPLCRSPIESDHHHHHDLQSATSNVNQVVIAVNETATTRIADDGIGGGLSPGYCSSCRHDEEEMNTRVRTSSSSSSSLIGTRRKPPLVPIEVPIRTGDDFGAESLYKSPIRRIGSYKRILSRGSIASPSGGVSWVPSELDLERGRDELTPRNRIETPREMNSLTQTIQSLVR